MSQKTIYSFLIAGASTLLALAFSCLSWFGNFEADTWDWRVATLAEPDKASDEICVILLDQSSLDWLEDENGINWPLPREIYKLIVDYSHQSGAKSIAFDVLFTESMEVEDDKSFAATMAQTDSFVLAARLTNGNDESQLPQGRVNSSYKVEFPSGEADISHFSSMEMPIVEFLEKAKVLSHVTGSADADGVNRKLAPFYRFNKDYIPVLGLGAYLAAHDSSQVTLMSDGIKLGDRFIPVDKKGNALLRFRGPSQTHKTFSAAQILQSYVRLQEGGKPVVKPEDLKDKYVFFGFSAPGLHDQHNVPVGGKYPGVEVHATFLDNLLQGDFFQGSPRWFNILLAFLLTIGASFFFIRSTSHLVQSVIALVFMGLPFAIAFLGASEGYRLDLVMPGTAVAFTLFLSVGYNYMTEGRQKKFIKYAFKHYLSAHVIDQLISDPDKLKLGGERSEISIFFSDLQGFTTISERLEPEVLIEVLNDYLSAMSDIILEAFGTIDKYEGDAIIAFWNAPLRVKNHPVQAVGAALECQRVLGEMQERLREKTKEDLKMRIGLHTGPAVVGNMGAKERFDYTMLGDAVNLAARLEGVNKQFGTYTLISEETCRQLNGAFPVRELGRVAVVGRKEPVTVFEPMLEPEYKDRKAFLEVFDQGLQLFYEGKLIEAVAIFADNAENDPPSKFYQRKCEQLLKDGETASGGVWTMTSK